MIWPNTLLVLISTALIPPELNFDLPPLRAVFNANFKKTLKKTTGNMGNKNKKLISLQ